jgi:hypothetical protein
MVKHREGFGSQLDRLRVSPQALVVQVEAKGVEDDAFFVRHYNYQTLLKVYGRFMTCEAHSNYYPLMKAGWQHRAAFVIQFQPETDVEAGRFEGRVEHIATYQSMRFHSLEELLDFIAGVLAEVRDAEARQL